MKNTSAYKVTSEPMISNDSFCVKVDREHKLNMTVDKSAI